MSSRIPSFSSLPLNEHDPPCSAWGLYGENDQLGTLNRLDEDVIKEAATEIKTGKTFSLDWPLDAQSDVALFKRIPFQQRILNNPSFCINDDEWTLNSQSSSQWDGLRHFSYLDRRRFYNGATLADFGVPDSHNSAKERTGINDPNGIGSFAQKGIVGRGILLDWERWRVKNGKEDPEVFTDRTQITLDDLKTVIMSQKTNIKFGDILFIRSGYVQAYNRTPRTTIEPLRHIDMPPSIGLEQSEEMAEWLWSNFSAAAGDHPTLEAFPPKHISDHIPHFLHEVMIAGWGMPIGELFDLEALADHCEKTGRYEFFLTSKPCNVPGGVASPPNAIAIF